jgi:hypothetical protein
MAVHTLEPQFEKALMPEFFTALAKGRSAKKAEDEDAADEEEVDEVEDDWEKGEDEEDSWDPDFEEFDLPKSKKSSGAGKKGADEEEDFKIEEDPEFKDLFSGGRGGGNDFDDEDDDF